ncbi:MAG: hypothetical protein MJE68_21175, partial [Proteobacteria bacterium]|nr:hypothetical protein [Pseudomonadota bacterium]
MVSDKLQQHFEDSVSQHLTMISSHLLSLERRVQGSNTKSGVRGMDSREWNPDFVEADGAL